ncbi:MAG TPA: TonB-dependent receptor [Verrucomicrobiae bacterium]|nr:TonB-dependent receptor [Verrucomicrobiae bacterium]
MLSVLLAACCLVGGHVHTPTGAPIAHAHIAIAGPKSVQTTTDGKGDFSVTVPPGRYTLTGSARGFATISVDTGEIAADSRIDIALEPVDSPKLRVIGSVTVNGGYVLARNVIPEMDVTRQQMDALGYSNITSGLAQVPSAIVQHPDAGAPTAPEVVSLRGPDPSEDLVTLDGQTLNDGNTGDLDLSEFGVSAFQSINVTEGLGPADSEGSNTFGGALNLVSLQPTLQDHLTLSGMAGSYGTSQTWLNATGTVGKLGYALAGDNFQQAGQVNQWSEVYPVDGVPPYCPPPSGSVSSGRGPAAAATPTPNCPTLTHLGSSISARMGLVNLDYYFSQRADAGVRIFTLGDFRDESSALNGIAGNPPGTLPSDDDPITGQFTGSGNAVFGQSIRAYDAYSRSVLGAGSLLADVYASDDNVSLTGGSGAASPYDVSHDDTRYNEGLSWGRTFDDAEFAFGGYARQEALTGAGIAGTQSQSIDSYFLRAAQQAGSKLRLSGGLYDAHYTTFGNTLNWRLGASYDLDSTSAVRASAGTGFRAPLLLERYYFPAQADGQPNQGLTPLPGCVYGLQGNPNEKPEHATEYELSYSKLFATWTDLDFSVYRSNLRDTIENYFPFNSAAPASADGSFCKPYSAQGFAYEQNINIGNAVYEGSEVRLKQGFPRQHLTMVLSYGLNVAYPYALGPNVSNPTSGGSLVGDQQFLGVPQQQGSATMIWADRSWHAATAFTFAGRNNPLNQAPYTFTDVAVGKTFGSVDFTVSGTNVFNSVSGPFTIYNAGVPYRGIVGGTYENPAFGGLPTPRLEVLPAAVHFAITIHA